MKTLPDCTCTLSEDWSGCQNWSDSSLLIHFELNQSVFIFRYRSPVAHKLWWCSFANLCFTKIQPELEEFTAFFVIISLISCGVKSVWIFYGFWRGRCQKNHHVNDSQNSVCDKQSFGSNWFACSSVLPEDRYAQIDLRGSFSAALLFLLRQTKVRRSHHCHSGAGAES